MRPCPICKLEVDCSHREKKPERDYVDGLMEAAKIASSMVEANGIEIANAILRFKRSEVRNLRNN